MQKRTAMLDAVTIVYLMLLSLKIASDNDDFLTALVFFSMPIAAGTVVHLLGLNENSFASVACLWVVMFVQFFFGILTFLEQWFAPDEYPWVRDEYSAPAYALILAIIILSLCYPLAYMLWIRRRSCKRYFKTCAWVYATGAGVCSLGILWEYVDHISSDAGRLHALAFIEHLSFVLFAVCLIYRLTRGSREPKLISTSSELGYGENHCRDWDESGSIQPK